MLQGKDILKLLLSTMKTCISSRATVRELGRQYVWAIVESFFLVFVVFFYECVVPLIHNILL